MGNWSSLTVEEEALIENWMDQLLRPWAGHISRTLGELQVVKDVYVSPVAGISTLVASLADTDVIPNGSGLSGAVPITKAQLTPVLTALNALLTDYYASDDRERYVALAGGSNVIGG